MLAAANALDANTALVAGTTLKAPQVTTNKNDASTFKPYNPSDITGPTTPGLPHIPPPHKAGCGVLGMIIMIAVTILVTVYTAGAMTAAAGSSLSTIMGAGVDTLASGSIEAAAIGGAVGNIAGQITGNALGVVHGFSLTSVLTSAITAGIGAGVGSALRGVQLLTDGAPFVHGLQSLNTAGKLVDALANYGTSVVANAVTGQQTHFSWAAVGATAVGSILSSELGGNPQILKGGTALDGFVNNLTSYAIDGAVNAGARQLFGLGKPNWKQVATDAFGNALAGTIIGAAIADSDPKTRIQTTGVQAPLGDMLTTSELSKGAGGFAPGAFNQNMQFLNDGPTLARVEVIGVPDPAIVATRDFLSAVLQLTGLTHTVDAVVDAYHHSYLRSAVAQFTHYVTGLNAQAQANVARMQVGLQQAQSYARRLLPAQSDLASTMVATGGALLRPSSQPTGPMMSAIPEPSFAEKMWNANPSVMAVHALEQMASKAWVAIGGGEKLGETLTGDTIVADPLTGQDVTRGDARFSTFLNFFSLPAGGEGVELNAVKDSAAAFSEVANSELAATTGPKTYPGFNEGESQVINEAQGVINSPELSQIQQANASGQPLTVTVNGRIIQYEPDLPASGMTMFGENGFLIGPEAFTSQDELQQTILHELYRLNTSASADGVSGSLATQETQAAADFAAKANHVIKGP